MQLTQEKFLEKYMRSALAPPVWSNNMDVYNYILSELAKAKVIDMFNSKTKLKCWSFKDEKAEPDIFVDKCGYIEVGQFCGNLNIYSRKIDSFKKWGSKYGTGAVLAYYEMSTGDIYMCPFNWAIEQIDKGSDKFIKRTGDRGPNDYYYTVDKSVMTQDIARIEKYFLKHEINVTPEASKEYNEEENVVKVLQSVKV